MRVAAVAGVIAAVMTGASGGAQVTAGATSAPVVRGTAPPHAIDVGSDPSQAATPLERAVTATFTNARLGDALDELAARAHVSIVYTDRVVPIDRRVTARLAGVPLGRALEIVLAGTGIVARRSGDRIALVRDDRADTTTAANGVIWGEVRDTASKLLVGAAVVISGDVVRSGTTNTNGYYAFQHLRAGVYKVQVRMIGYVPDERPVVVGDSQIVRADFVLRTRLARLDEVLVTATGVQRRMDIGNDIVSINVDSVMTTAPVRSVTDLLETRVPGLEVQHTSGAPGSPSRIRLRGLSSINRQNDPILVIDGVRMNISEDRNHSLAPSSVAHTSGYLAPSRLDQLDPNSVDKIEVMKGPSAASLYGPDAANGVIVVTTKRGRSGPTQWQATVSQGTSSLPGSYPEGLFRWGHAIDGGGPVLCPRTQYNCMQDSLVRFQALNDPRYSIFGRGQESRTSLTARGGSTALSYSFTGSYNQAVGILRLPDIEVQRYRKFHGTEPPSWMRRPDQLTAWSVTSQLSAQLSPLANLDFVSTLTNQKQQQSSLESAISQLQGAWIDESQLDQYGLVQSFDERATSQALGFTNVATLNWTPRPALSGFANVGLNVQNRDDKALLPAGLEIDPLAARGHFGRGTSHDLTTSLNVGARTFAGLPHGMRLTAAVGMNLSASTEADQQGSTYGLVSDEEPATFNFGSAQHTASQTTLGWFVEPRFDISPRLHLSPGFRIDGGSSTGQRARFNGLPKLDASWLVSDERFFPFRRQISLLRLRAAYGQATVQPGLTDRLRLYLLYAGKGPDGSDDPAARLRLQTIGNSRLRPERSVEFEGGFDLGMFEDRIAVDFTGYDKVRKDAIQLVALAPSVGAFSGGYNTNIGVIENSGTEVSLAVEPLRGKLATVRIAVNYSRNLNRLVRLAPGEKPLSFNDGSRIVPGYPLFGLWAKPIVGYADANRDGIIDSSEVVVGDSSVYLGQRQPRWHASFPITATLLGRVTVNATFDYQDSFTQFNQGVLYGGGGFGTTAFERAASDPNAPLSQQAAVAAVSRTPYGLIQTVNTFRFNSLSVSAPVSPRFAHAVGASSMSISIEGSNLALHTNYRGLDPSVNAFGSGEGIADTGLLPLPRTWSLTIRLAN